MAAENSASNGGEHATQSEQVGHLRSLMRTIGEPIVARRGDEIVGIGISHGVHEGAVWIRNAAGELDTYALDEFSFSLGDESEVAQYFVDSPSDAGDPSTI